MTTDKSSSSPSSLPIVDLSLPDEQASLQLGTACRSIGFFIIVNHGISPELIKTVFNHSSVLFNNMSQESKQHHAIRKDNRGYSFATEKLDPTSNQNDNKEYFNFVPDNNAIAEYCAENEEGDKKSRSMFFDDFRNPLSEEKILLSNDDDAENTTTTDAKNEFAHRWPSEKEGAPKDLRKVILTYINEVMKVSDRLHRLIAMDLKLENPATFFQPFFQNPMVTLRLLHYPQEEQQQEQKDGVADDGKSNVVDINNNNNNTKLAAGEHTDYDSLTFLVTDSTPGLQVRDRQTDKWIDAPTFPKDALGEYIIVNIADCLMRWTNDLYKSTPHRVLQPTQERYSCALFVGPQGRTKIEALPGTGEAKYEETTAFEHLMMKLGMTCQFLQK